jgi:hypothetical protein
VILVPQVRSAIREITASYDAKALYSRAQRSRARRCFNEDDGKPRRDRRIRPVAQIGLPAIIRNAIGS